MIKKVSPVISPELLKILAEMGHGETIVLADANYPVMTGKVKHVIRADGIGILELLGAVLELLPIDNFVKKAVGFMNADEGDPYTPAIQDRYKEILEREGVGEEKIEYLDRLTFYKKADEAYCIVATGERARYANVILKKGIFEADE